MKSSLYILTSIILFLVSCKKSETEITSQQTQQSQQTFFKIGATSILLNGVTGSTDSFSIQSNIDWSISISPSTSTWLKVNASKGTGSKTIIVSGIEENTTGSPRTATINITPVGNNSFQPTAINVTQLSVSKLKTDSTTLSLLGLIGSTNSFTIESTINWKITSDATWLSFTPAIGSGKQTIQVSAVQSNTGFSRLATVTISPVNDNTAKPVIVLISQKTATILTTYWSNLFGSTVDETVSKMIKTADGGYIVVGTTSGNNGDFTANHGGNDGFVMKFNAYGIKQWSKLYGGSAEDHFNSITSTPDGGYIVAGASSSKNGDVSGLHGTGTYYDGWAIKIEENRSP